VLRVSKGGGAPVTIASGQIASNGVAVDDANVYWVSAGMRDGVGAVRKAAKGGGPVVTLASAQASPGAIAVDAHCVYWLNAGTSAANENDGAVMMIAK